VEIPAQCAKNRNDVNPESSIVEVVIDESDLNGRLGFDGLFSVLKVSSSQDIGSPPTEQVLHPKKNVFVIIDH
jgi:hypothetical protein